MTTNVSYYLKFVNERSKEFSITSYRTSKTRTKTRVNDYPHLLGREVYIAAQGPRSTHLSLS